MAAPVGLDWDEGNREKCGQHGGSIADIESLFRGHPRCAPDLAQSWDEDRFIAIGRSAEGRPLFVAFTFRERGGERLVRPISARYMHAKEARRYAEESARDEDG